MNKVLKCDYCKTAQGFWFGDTSVKVCVSPECQERNQKHWEEHCRKIDEEFEEKRAAEDAQ